MRAHVPQQPLLLLPALPDGDTLLHTQLAKAKQDLEKRLALELGFISEHARWLSERINVRTHICTNHSHSRQQNQVLWSQDEERRLG